MSLLKIALAGGLVTALAAGGAFMFWPQSSAQTETPKPEVVAESPPVPRIRAKIIVELPGGVSCSLGAFDNTTGRVSDLSDPCSTAPNWDGSVHPMGTI